MLVLFYPAVKLEGEEKQWKTDQKDKRWPSKEDNSSLTKALFHCLHLLYVILVFDSFLRAKSVFVIIDGSNFRGFLEAHG